MIDFQGKNQVQEFDNLSLNGYIIFFKILFWVIFNHLHGDIIVLTLPFFCFILNLVYLDFQ